jgi:hypothetical protein
MRGCISSCHRLTHFLESRSIGVFPRHRDYYPLFIENF